jgi:LysR family transcriptional regulator, regulator for bpeEF and oprC
MTLEQLKILVKVVQAGSFTKAADLLGTQKSYLSRVVSQLEAELGVKLLARTTRTLSLTEAGREVHERAVGILGAVDDTVRMAQRSQGEPKGQLRLTCGVELGSIAVGRWIEEYLETYPLATVDAEYTSRVLDLVHEGFDLAIRVGPIGESRLMARPIGQIEYGLFACPRYLASKGAPLTLENLQQHSLITFAGGGPRRGWQLTRIDETDVVKVDAPSRLRVNNSFAVRDALLRGLGIGHLPLLIASESVARKRLVPVLAQWRPVPAPVHALYPSNRYLSPKVRAFIDLAVERFPASNALARKTTEKACRSRPGAVD